MTANRRLPLTVTTLLLLLLGLAALPALAGSAASPARGQAATPAAVSCDRAAPAPAPPAAAQDPATPPAVEPVDGEQTSVAIGYVAVSIYAPVFVAEAKGYYAEQGLDVTLEPFAGGADPVALTASGQLQAAAVGAGPAFWNAAAAGLPLTVVAPGHQEGAPVATPLMISRQACEAGAIRSVADLAGKRVSVNAPGATEYWLSQALGTGGLALDDVQLQTLPFPEAVVALGSGAIDAAMVGEPLATRAEQDGIAVRLATDFPVQDVLPTVLIVNSDFLAENPEAVQGLVTAYLKASRDLGGAGFRDPANLAIIEQYTEVPAGLIGQAVAPVYSVDGAIDPVALGALQRFFRERGLLEYDQDLDPATLIDPGPAEAANAELGAAGGS